MSCPQCGCVSDPGAAHGRLLLAPPLGHTESKVRRGLREAGLDVATEDGLLFTLDREARIAAVRAAGEWVGDERVFVNFNPTSIYDPEYCLRTTVQAVGEAALSADQFVFEVVETEEVGRVDDLVDILDYYRDAGFSVALDDLGSGYASLSFLNRLQPDVVKLDMELIRDVDSTPYKAEVASQIFELADRIGAESVAEGVESEEEWAWVRDHGATYASGFLFGRPAPGERWAGPKRA